MAKKTTAKTARKKYTNNEELQEAIKKGLNAANEKLRTTDVKIVKKAWAGGVCDFIAKSKDMTKEEHEQCMNNLSTLPMKAPVPDNPVSKWDNVKKITVASQEAAGIRGGNMNKTPEGKARIATGMLATARIGETKKNRKANRWK